MDNLFYSDESLWITENSDAETGVSLYDDEFPLIVENESAEEFEARMIREILFHQTQIESRDSLANIAAAFA